MSAIPYLFETPVPKYFREAGWLKHPKTAAFIMWCYQRCYTEARNIQHDNKKITLQPYQFIFGRRVCSEETGLTEDEVRAQQLIMLNANFLKKAPNKTPNRFTIYECVLTDFIKTVPQQNPQSTPNSPPTNPHKQEARKEQKDIICLKETRKKKKVAASLPLLKKEQEDSEVLFAYLSNYSISIPAINRWLKIHTMEKIIKTITLMKRRGDKITTHGAWLESALKGNYAQEEEFRLLNREFAIKFQNEKNLKVLKINKNYCVDIETQEDYQYKLPPEDFQNMLKRKYI